MSFDWVTPVRRALDERGTRLPMFVRDDDAGWADARLDALLHVAADAGCVVDLAVIPGTLDAARADWLLERWQRSAGRVRLHQHGWSHENHEPIGRKSEFGVSRPIEDIWLDLTRGRARMQAHLGEALDPVFTPPWNRCRTELGTLLLREGFTVLSRDRTAGTLDVPGLLECPVTVDWFAKERGVRADREQWASRFGRAVREDAYLGLMLHHAVTDADELKRIGALLGVLATHPQVRCLPLVQVAAQEHMVATASVPVGTFGKIQ